MIKLLQGVSLQKILLVDDCPLLCSAIEKVLSGEYAIQTALTLLDAKIFLDRENFDLVILDLDLPDGSGLQFCSHIRREEDTKETPIIILSGQSDFDTKTTGLDLGADDFIAKPFNKNEFCARIRARLRTSRSTQMEILKKGPFTVDRHAQKIFISESNKLRDLSLTKCEYIILLFLLQKDSQVFSRNDLIEGCFGKDYNVSARAMDLHVFGIRNKIGDHHNFIKTVYGAGYKIAV